MTTEQTLWNKEHGVWANQNPRIDDRHLTREGGTAILTYRMTGTRRPVRCRSTYARACGSWMLVEHSQTAI